MRQTPEIGLRRAGDHERFHPGRLGRHDVHHHAGWIDGVAARHVEADPFDGHPALGHGGAGSQLRDAVGPALIGVHRPGAGDRHFESGPHRRIQLGQGTGQRSRGHADGFGAYAVEGLTEFQGRDRTAFGNGLDDRPDPGHHGVHVHAPARQRGTQLRRRQHTATQIDPGHLETSHPGNCP